MKGKFLLKKIVVVGALLMVLFAVECGCSAINDKTEPKSRVELHIWGNQQEENGFDIIMRAYEASHENVKIVYHQYTSSDVTENGRLETNLLAGGNNVDVYFTYSTQELSKRVNSGMALNLQELCQRDGFDMVKYFTSEITKFYYNGCPYAVPTTVGMMGIILNKDMFEAAGIEIPVEWDYETFREVCKKLTKTVDGKKVYGVFWNTRADMSEAIQHLILPVLGGDPLYNNETETNFDDPVIVKALELMNDTMNKDHTAPTHQESMLYRLTMEDMFFNEECAMTVGAWMFANALDLKNYPHTFETAFAPWPLADLSQKNYTQGSFGNHLSINPSSKNIDEAWEFIKWYATEGMKPNISKGYTPCCTSFSRAEVEEEFLRYTDGLIDGESAMRVMLNPDMNLTIPVIENRINSVTEIFEQAMEQVLMGKAGAQDALAEAKKRADLLLAED